MKKVLAATRHILPMLLLAVILGTVYGGALSHDFLSTWDDDRYVTANEAVKGISYAHITEAFSTYYVGNYAPLQIVSYMVDYTLWGLTPKGFILSNILMHLLSGLLLYLLVLQLQESQLAAFLAAGLFLLHPVQVESVVWISQRKNVLAMVFFLLALYAYRCYLRDQCGRNWWYAASVTIFFAALLTKSVTIVLPLVLLVHDACFRQGVPWRQRLADKLPFILAAAVATLLAFHSQSAEFEGGRMGYFQDSRLLHLFTMLPVLVSYLGLLVWPVQLSAIYKPSLKTGMDGEVAAAALALLIMVLIGVYLFRRRKDLAFWYLLFFVGLLPVSHIIPLASLMNDRYLYFPMLGAAGLFGAITAQIAGKLRTSGGRRLTILLTLSLLLVAAMFARHRTAVWRNSLSLWSDTARKVPNSKEAWLFLAETIYLDTRNPIASLGPYLKVLDLDPDYPFSLNSVGTYGDTGRFLREHLELKKLIAKDPANYALLLRLGDNYSRDETWQEAAQYYKLALTINAASPEALTGLARCTIKLDQSMRTRFHKVGE